MTKPGNKQKSSVERKAGKHRCVVFRKAKGKAHLTSFSRTGREMSTTGRYELTKQEIRRLQRKEKQLPLPAQGQWQKVVIL